MGAPKCWIEQANRQVCRGYCSNIAADHAPLSGGFAQGLSRALAGAVRFVSTRAPLHAGAGFDRRPGTQPPGRPGRRAKVGRRDGAKHALRTTQAREIASAAIDAGGNVAVSLFMNPPNTRRTCRLVPKRQPINNREQPAPPRKTECPVIQTNSASVGSSEGLIRVRKQANPEEPLTTRFKRTSSAKRGT